MGAVPVVGRARIEVSFVRKRDSGTRGSVLEFDLGTRGMEFEDQVVVAGVAIKV